MRWKALLLSGAMLIALAACGAPQEPEQNEPPAEDGALSVYGNMYAGNLYMQFDEHRYRLQEQGGGYNLVTGDEAQTVVLEDVLSCFITEKGLYYVPYNDGEEPDGLYYADFDGQNAAQIGDVNCMELVGTADRIFYTDADGVLYTALADGTEQMVLDASLDEASNLQIVDGTLWFMTRDTSHGVGTAVTLDGEQKMYGQGSMYSCPLDGETLTPEAVAFSDNGGICRFYVLGDQLWYVTNNALYAADLTTGEGTKMTDGGAVAPQAVNVYADRYLIYSDITREKTYRYDTESKSELELLDGYYDYLYIADGQLHAIGAEEQTVALA